jgi:hypothetical protein
MDGRIAIRLKAVASKNVNLADSGYSSTNPKNNAQTGDSVETSWNFSIPDCNTQYSSDSCHSCCLTLRLQVKCVTFERISMMS